MSDAGSEIQAPPTITAIARRAGVSHSTVSLILNNRDTELRLNAQTAERVRRIARDMNYTPNLLARGLRGKRTQSVGVLWSLCGPHPSEASARRITLLTQQRGYSALLADSLSEPKVICSNLAEFARRRADGVIVQLGSPDLAQDPAIRRLLDAFKAVVVVGREPMDTPFDQVHHSSDEALESIVDHLASTGRRRIATLGSMANPRAKVQAVVRRMETLGYREPLQMIEFDYVSGQTTAQEIHGTLAQAAGRGVAYDALLCGTDELAAAAMMWHQGRGQVVPRDVAIVGFNDHSLSQFLAPPLASVRRHDDRVSDVAVQLFFDRLCAPHNPPQRRTVAMQFMARPSAGAATPA
jgi:DNA-binding LacI/PurR family transcriptional regulator